MTPKNEDDASGSWVSSPKDCVFPETIPEEASSLEEERVVIFRLPATTNPFEQSFYTADASLLQQQTKQMQQQQHQHRSHFTFDTMHMHQQQQHIQQHPPERSVVDVHAQPKLSSSTERDSQNGSLHPDHNGAASVGDDGGGAGGGSGGCGGTKVDVFAATFLDVAVLRCLFVEHWQEDGVYWCLHYMYNR